MLRRSDPWLSCGLEGRGSRLLDIDIRVIHKYLNVILRLHWIPRPHRKCSVPSLRKLAEEQIRDELERNWHDDNVLLGMIEEIYTKSTNGDGELRDAIVSTAARNAQTLLVFRRHSGFREGAEAFPSFAMALASSIALGRDRWVDLSLLPSRTSDAARRYTCVSGIRQAK